MDAQHTFRNIHFNCLIFKGLHWTFTSNNALHSHTLYTCTDMYRAEARLDDNQMCYTTSSLNYIWKYVINNYKLYKIQIFKET